MIEKILRFCVAFFLGLCLLIPLVVYVLTPFPFILAKVVFFRVFCSLAFFCWFVLALRDWRRYGVRLNSVLVCLVCLIVCFFVSSFGDSFSRSFFGSLERGESLLGYLYYLCFFVVLSSFLRSFGEFKYLFHIAAFSASLFSLSVVFDYFGLLGFGGVIRSLDHASGLAGNSCFVSAVSLFGLFSCLFLMFVERSRFIPFIGIAVNFASLIFCFSRGGWFGFACGFAFFFFTLVFSKGFNYSLRVWLLSMFAVFIFGFFVVLIPFGKDDHFEGLRETSLFQRYLQAFQGDKSRTFVWSMALESIWDNKWRGSGFYSFETVYSRYFKKEYQPILTPAVPYDLPHNKFLEVMADSGGIAGVFYLGLFFLALFYLKKFQPLPYFFPVFGGWLVAYFVQNLFLFDTINSQLFFFFGLALISSLKYTAPIDMLTHGRVSTIIRVWNTQKKKGTSAMYAKRSGTRAG